VIEIFVSERERASMLPVDEEYAGPGWLVRSVVSDPIVCEVCGLNLPGAVAKSQQERALEHRKSCQP
jgi:hypothetical protein